jgi:hypothetical protein
MNEDERRAAYASAFLKQARSDWNAFRAISVSAPPIETCHRLHYLQMACEKIAKAYRLRDTSSAVDDLVSKHTGFAKFIAQFLMAIRDEYAGRHAQHAAVLHAARNYAREIEKLAPAIDRTWAPENAEYPWEQNGAVVTPCEFTYPALSFLRTQGGFAFLKLVQRALDDFHRVALI